MTENYSYQHPRSHWAITFSVWKALFLREAVTRISNKRAAWAWLLIDPVIQMVLLILMFTFIRLREVGGIDMQAWLIAGLMSYAMFRQAGNQGKNALSANASLFTYRQVKPVDAVLVRVALEGILSVLVTLILACGALLFGIDITPDDPLYCFAGFLGLWLMGLGYALIASVAVGLIPELGKILDIIMTPLYLLSGVIFPLERIPPQFRDWLLYNPLAHGVEAARVGVSNFYHPFPGLDLPYLYQSALVAIFLGLALQRKYQEKLIAR